MKKVYTCNICGVTSDMAPFYKGVSSRCKECHKAKVRENREEKAEYYRAYDAKRFKEDPKVRARHRRYQKTDAGRAALKKSRDKWSASNSDKRAAHCILNNAVRDGRKKKPDRCEACGEKHHRIHGHHRDYTRPLDVQWLCPVCHVAEHRRIDAMNENSDNQDRAK